MIVKEYSVVLVEIDNYSSRQRRVLRCYKEEKAKQKVQDLISYYTGMEEYALAENSKPSDGANLVKTGSRINIKVETVEIDLEGFPGIEENKE